MFDAGGIRIGYVLRSASMLVTVHRAESNCIIRNVRVHIGALSGVEAGGGNRVYAG